MLCAVSLDRFWANDKRQVHVWEASGTIARMLPKSQAP